MESICWPCSEASLGYSPLLQLLPGASCIQMPLLHYLHSQPHQLKPCSPDGSLLS